MTRLLRLLLLPKPWRWLFVVLLLTVCYLTLKPRPQISEVSFIPGGMAEFFDLYDDWKNVAGFGALAFAGFLGWQDGWGRKREPTKKSGWLQLCSLIGIVFLMEILQVFIPTRYCDVKDMFWGTVGVLLARGLVCVLLRFKDSGTSAKTP
jgi:hypothetical protein